MKLAVVIAAAGFGLSLAGCVSPARTPGDAYYAPPAEQTTTTYYEPGTGAATTTTTTRTTVYRDGAYSYGPSGRGNTYDDPHHYGRGYNQHKY